MRASSRLCSFALAVAAAAGSAAAQGAAVKDIPFDELGKAFLARHCPDGSEVAQCSLEKVLASSYVRLRLGAFELYYPAHFLEDKKKVEDLREIATVLLDLQKTWLSWMDPGSETTASVHADIKALQDWIATWKPQDVAKAAEAQSKDLLEHLRGADTVKETFGRVQLGMASSSVLGFDPRSPTVQIIGCPTRRDFMEMVSYVGRNDSWRTLFWVDGVDQWTQFWIERTMVLALEYASWEGFDPQFRRGRDMRTLEKTGIAEHVIQRAGSALFNFYYGRPEPRHFEDAVALDLAIEICGQCNTIDGEDGISNSGAQTIPYERFVPGGNPAGGVLPAIPAAPFDTVLENHWRVGTGKDHFVGPLQKGQKDGARRATKDRDKAQRKDELAHFTLSSKQGGKHVVTAPFFGPHAKEQQYPATEFMNDYREFFRSYRTAFVHWLRTGAAGAESPAKFARVLRGLSSIGQSGKTLDQLVEEVYGAPISGQNGDTDSLEWQFLNWIADAKVK